MMDAFGRYNPGAEGTDGDGDCGVRAVLQSLFRLQTPDASDNAMNVWADSNITETRRSLADTIRTTDFLRSILKEDLVLLLNGKRFFASKIVTIAQRPFMFLRDGRFYSWNLTLTTVVPLSCRHRQ
jgi:hypothetical protein